MRERGRVERVRSMRRRGSINVVQSENAVHAVLHLVRVFVNGSIRMRLREVEYVGRLFIVVYVGAIAVLFRFVVMMLNVSGVEDPKAENEEGRARVGRVGLIGGGALLREDEVNQVWLENIEWVKLMDSMGTMEVIGQVLYTHGVRYVLVAGMVLLVAMMGAIVLTLQVGTLLKKIGGKRQQIGEQRSRDDEAAVMRVAAGRQTRGKRG